VQIRPAAVHESLGALGHRIAQARHQRAPAKLPTAAGCKTSGLTARAAAATASRTASCVH
jgi:hypothetical protein